MSADKISGEIGGDGVAHLLRCHLGKPAGGHGGINDNDVRSAQHLGSFGEEMLMLLRICKIKAEAIAAPHLVDTRQRTGEMIGIAP